ncbi:MAG TPA: endonuclease III [Planctomycetota bacterium]|nr:endonuclease III [Planctomycetota bacterium]
MKSSKSSTPERLKKIVRTLARVYGEAHCALVHHNALELLVATILSAQCTDHRVNIVTETLFKKYRSAKEFAEADPAVLEQDIRSTGFFRTKAKSIRGAARRIVELHGGEVPSTMEDLLELPGVARKTANVVLGTWFGKAAGIVVDTHVHRISRRLQLTREDDPKKIEQDLMKLLPTGEWINFSHRLIWHGRKICAARKPKCGECPIAGECPSAGKIA